jgi:hypothetical protein
MALLGRQPVVARSLRPVLRHALAALEADAEAALRSGIALLGRQSVVAHGLHQILRHALAVLEADAEAELRDGMTSLCG